MRGIHRGLTAAVALVLLAGALAACGGSRRVLVPPRLDLRPYGTLGLVTFTQSGAEGALNQLATSRFADEIFANQTGVEVLELGAAEPLLEGAGEREFTARAVRWIGEEHGVPAVFVGHLTVSDVKPRAGFVGLRLPRVEATVAVDLTVRLVNTETGGTMWRNSGRIEDTVGQVGLDSGGVPYFSAEDPEEAYGRLVNALVHELTYDLRPTWRRQ